MLKLALSLLLAAVALAQSPPNLDCKCKSTGIDKYTCECTAKRTAVIPTYGPNTSSALRPQPAVPEAPAVPPPPAKTGLTITSNEAPAAETRPRATPKVSEAPKATATSTGAVTSTGQPIDTGPRGGQYHYSVSGKKVYTRKK